MSRYTISAEELYPIYDIELVTKASTDFDKKWSIDIPDDKVEWIERSLAIFDEVQDYLEKLQNKIYKEKK